MHRYYFDNAATTCCNEKVLEEMLPYFSKAYGNPSSIHSFGRDAKKAVSKAREQVAHLLKANPTQILFTSSGTEADNLAVFNSLKPEGKKHIITSAIEHPAILEPFKELEKKGYRVTYLPVDNEGIVSEQALIEALCEETSFVSIMHANNEVGVIQPIERFTQIVREKEKLFNTRILFHTDAVQTFGSISLDVQKLDVDLLSCSSHKIYGPKGAGALFIKHRSMITPSLFGGGQERNLRSSTENVPAIVGFGKAAEMAEQNLLEVQKEISFLRDYLIKTVKSKISDVMVNGSLENRLPGNANLSFAFVEGESILMNLDLKGFAVSTGSACSSGALEPSHVLLSMGFSHERAHGSIRFSLGKMNTKEEIDHLIHELVPIIDRLRKMSPLYKNEGKN
ncbi:MAG TPA: cysteine desulfurase family protein [Chlamydiales bacterium]|nr:cysteine desulfurase family protein [Chlamydiales bacterium]